MRLTRILWGAAAARVALAMVALTVGGTASPIREPNPDGYYQLAYWLAHRMVFSLDGVTPELFRLPGYPAVLVPGMLLGHPLTIGLLINLIASLVTVWIVYDTARILGATERGATVAALVVAFDPVLMVWSTRLMAETVFTMLLAALVLCIVRLDRNGALYRVVPLPILTVGGLLAILIYVRPVALVVPLALLAGVLGLRARGGGPQPLRVVMVAVLVCAGLLLPWVIRNGVVAGYWGLTTLPARASYLAIGAAVDAQAAGRPFHEERARRLEDVRRSLGEHGPDVYARVRDEGLASVRSRPVETLVMYVSGVLRTLVDPGGLELVRLLGGYPVAGGFLNRVVQLGTVGAVSELARERPGLMVVLVATAIPLGALLVLASTGFHRLAKRQWHLAMMTASIAVALLACAGGPHGNSRFRHPVVPLLAVWAAFACGAPGCRNEFLAKQRPQPLPTTAASS